MEQISYTLDFTNISDVNEMHTIIRDALGFPDYYGRNWSAFWDCITELYGEPICIEIIGLDVLNKSSSDAASMLIAILQRFKHYSNDKFSDAIDICVVNGNDKVHLE